MSEREMKDLMKELQKKQQEVRKSKDAAKEYLIQIGVLTAGGNLKKAFKAG